MKTRCIVCVLIAAIEVCLSIVFFACVFTGKMRVAGIFEWIITFIGVGYLISLVGLTMYVLSLGSHCSFFC